MIAVTLAVELLLMNIIGIAIRKTGVTNKEFSNRLTSLLMKFCIPCLIFNSISNAMEFSLESLSNCLVDKCSCSAYFRKDICPLVAFENRRRIIPGEIWYHRIEDINNKYNI